MLQWLPEFDRLLTEAKNALASDPKAVEAVAVITAKGNIYSLTGHEVGSYIGEFDFFEMLKQNEETAVSYLTAMTRSSDYGVVPAFTFASLLAALDHRNEDAMMLMWGIPRNEPQAEPQYVTKPLKFYTDRPQTP